MVVINAAIALAALCHVVAIEPRVGHRGRVRVAAVAASGATTESSVGLVLLGPPEEESSTTKGGESNDTNHDSGCDRSSVVTALGLCLNRCTCAALFGGCYFSCLLTRCGRNSGASGIGFRGARSAAAGGSG